MASSVVAKIQSRDIALYFSCETNLMYPCSKINRLVLFEKHGAVSCADIKAGGQEILRSLCC